MLVGVVKLAPTLPLDANFPYLHLDRKFMHLGFHIYDVGFQSPNVEAARPLVYATALLLVTLIVALNLTAITLRGRLERLYRGSRKLMSMTQQTPEAEAPLGEKLEETSLRVNDLSLFYGEKQALANINMGIATRKVTAFIGPSGCGKSTLLRCFNRMNDLIDDVSITGDIDFEERSIYDERVDVASLRRKIGMVFQRPNPFLKAFMKMSPTACVFKAKRRKPSLMNALNGR